MNNKKCSSEKHKETNSVSYCQECRIYMCNKCENHHSELFKNHHQYKLDKDINEIFTGYCKENTHLDKLKFFCKNHNKLCCSSCITKIKGKDFGQHSECDVCIIEDIKEEKKKNLKENIQNLENQSKIIEDTINKLKIIFEKINENKEDLKQKIQKIFTKIRNGLNEREDELLLKVDKEFENFYFNEDIIKESQKIPNKIKISLEKSKIIEKSWDDVNKLNLLINDCIYIENNLKNINNIIESLNKTNKSNNFKFEFYPKKDNIIDELIQTIKNFGNISFCNNLELFSDSLILNKNELYFNNLIGWINPKNKITTKLLYRKSKDGDSYDTFHKLCDNQGATLILIKTNEKYIIGGFTPLNWDNELSDWKDDNDTFLFNLTNNKIYNKSKKNHSIYCGKDQGPWFAFIGFRETGKKNMSQGEFLYKTKDSDIYFKDINTIIPHKKENRYFDVEEVEVYKIIFE